MRDAVIATFLATFLVVDTGCGGEAFTTNENDSSVASAGAGNDASRDSLPAVDAIGEAGGSSLADHAGDKDGVTSSMDVVDTAPESDTSSTGQPDAPLDTGAMESGHDGSKSIFCGAEKCDPGSQVCCAEIGALDPGSAVPLRCVSKGTCSGTSPMNIPCDDKSDCSQGSLPVCCVGTSYGDPNGRFILVECTTQLGCATTANVRHEIMCNGPDDHDSCPVGKACAGGLLRDGFFTCQ